MMIDSYRFIKERNMPPPQESSAGSYDGEATADSVEAKKRQAAVSLNQIAIEMINRVELSSLLQHIADKTAELTNADYSYVGTVHESGDWLETIAASNNSRYLKSVRHKPGEGIAGQVWLTGKTVCEPNYQYYQHRLPGLTRARQACSVPLKIGNRVIGVFGILYENDINRIEDQVEVLEMFAPLASVAIENAELHEHTRHELARTDALSRISRAIYESDDFDIVIDQICTTLLDTFDACKTHLYKIENKGIFTPLAAWEKINGRVIRAKQAGAKMVARSVASWCIENQRSAFIKRGFNDVRESSDVHRIRARWKLGSTICLPLVHEDKSWGVLFAHRSVERADFTESELKQLELISAQISMALLRRELMEKVQYQAYYDNLTGLHNRWRFESLLTESVEESKHSSCSFAVLFVDIDGFKVVNDSYGYRVGNQLLQSVAAILSTQIGSEDVLARMGGDEFSVIVSSRTSRQDVKDLADRISRKLSNKVEIDNHQVNAMASIGVCFYPTDATTVEEVLKHANVVMHHAKDNGRGEVTVFNHSLLVAHEKQRQLEQDLQPALETGQFELFYQPQVCCENGEVDGVEALIRWNHPELGLVPPCEFIAVAEKCGFIQAIGTWVMGQACRDCVQLRKTHGSLRVAVNISAHQFNIDDFVQSVFSALSESGLPAYCLELEVTESVVMHDIAAVVEKLRLLRDGGVTIAIDDFGTGYSSLQYLVELPLDVIKIDKSFVDRIAGAAQGPMLANTILKMAQELGLKTVAEGVESEAQKDQLRQLDCDYIQGYYYSKPAPVSELTDVISTINCQSQHKSVAGAHL